MNKRSVLLTILSIFVLGNSAALSQKNTPKTAEEVLTNDSVIQLVKAGLEDELVMIKIKESKSTFNLGTDELVRLKKEGVSSQVIKCMMNPAHCDAPKSSGATVSAPSLKSATDATSSSSKPASVENDTTSPVTEIGVYYKKEGTWVEVLPELVNWKTGGVLKSIASAGIVKKDVNGNVNGPHSRNSVNTPLEFLIYAPEGVAITEYQFLRLRAKKDYREFRTVTGGVFNQRGGALRDLVPFEGKKIASRTFLVILPNNLGAGEYGFLPPGSFMSAGASSSLGKMYTFRLLE